MLLLLPDWWRVVPCDWWGGAGGRSLLPALLRQRRQVSSQAGHPGRHGAPLLQGGSSASASSSHQLLLTAASPQYVAAAGGQCSRLCSSAQVPGRRQRLRGPRRSRGPYDRNHREGGLLFSSHCEVESTQKVRGLHLTSSLTVNSEQGCALKAQCVWYSPRGQMGFLQYQLHSKKTELEASLFCWFSSAYENIKELILEGPVGKILLDWRIFC